MELSKAEESVDHGGSAISHSEPSITSTGLTLAHESTILPTRVADLITALASSTRLTISGVAFFIETILETSQFSTRISLGYTRKLLINAISSARRVYLLSNAALSGDVLTLLNYKDASRAKEDGDAFLQVLDRYTNLGVYVIHHAFTLAELFTMSSFYIAGSAVSSSLAAARESVGLLDSIFGSNESSRTLASIIALVRREVMLDERSKGKRGVVSTLGGLTKAMTAFAVLQNATWAKTEQRIKMKVIHDYTVRARGDRDKHSKLDSVELDTLNEVMPEGAVAGPGPSTMASRQVQTTVSLPRIRSNSSIAGLEERLPHHTNDITLARRDHEVDDLASELEEFMGRDDITEMSDELSESDAVVQLLEQVQVGRIPVASDLSEEEEWIEVDRILDGEDLPAPIRPISPEDASDHSRLHVVLQNMARRIRKRRGSQPMYHEDGGHDPPRLNTSIQTPSVTPPRNPGPAVAGTTSPLKRPSPFRAIVQAKSAFARRLRLRTPPSHEADVANEVDDTAAQDLEQAPKPAPAESQAIGKEPVKQVQREIGLPKDESPAVLFPHDSLIANLHRFMRYSSAAYGQHFLRILRLGTGEYNFTSTGGHHFNSWAFARHTNIAIDSLLHYSHTDSGKSPTSDKALPLVHYVSVDHNLKSIILTCRGTLGLSDILIDLTCDYQDISLDNGERDARYYVHKGMYQSAMNLTSRHSAVHQGLVKALTLNPGYGLVVCGHSLGGGVAAAFAIISSTPSSTFKEGNGAADDPVTCGITTPFVTSLSSGLPPGRPIHAFAYGPPALASPDLARYAEGLITSVVLDKDVVPCLSLGVLRDLKNIALTLHEEDKVAEEIIGRIAGMYKRRFGFGTSRKDSATTAPPEEAVLSDWLASLINTMRADMDNDKLYPPGCVYIMEYHEVFPTDTLPLTPTDGADVARKKAYRALLQRCESVELRFREPIFTKSMLRDHLPSGYERATQLLYDGIQDKTHIP